jgi:hypothetical protein
LIPRRGREFNLRVPLEDRRAIPRLAPMPKVGTKMIDAILGDLLDEIECEAQEGGDQWGPLRLEYAPSP